MRAFLKTLFASLPVRAVTKAAMAISGTSGRLASAMRAAAIFPGAQGLVCHWTVEVKYPENIELGRDVILGPGSLLGAKAPIRLGDHVHLSRDVLVETAGLDFSTRAPPYAHVAKPIVVGKGVWVGARAIILGGVTIGEFAVIAAGSVIARDVPAGAIAGGVPGRVIRGDGANHPEPAKIVDGS